MEPDSSSSRALGSINHRFEEFLLLPVVQRETFKKDAGCHSDSFEIVLFGDNLKNRLRFEFVCTGRLSSEEKSIFHEWMKGTEQTPGEREKFLFIFKVDGYEYPHLVIPGNSSSHSTESAITGLKELKFPKPRASNAIRPFRGIGDTDLN